MGYTTHVGRHSGLPHVLMINAVETPAPPALHEGHTTHVEAPPELPHVLMIMWGRRGGAGAAGAGAGAAPDGQLRVIPKKATIAVATSGPDGSA